MKLAIVGAYLFSNLLGYEASTNAKGHFKIERMAAGDYTVSVSFPGYVSVDQQVSLTAGVGAKLNLTLENAMKKVA